MRELSVDNQHIAAKSIKDLKKLKQQLNMANQCLIEKDRIIEGLRSDLANLVEQLPRLQPNKFNKAH